MEPRASAPAGKTWRVALSTRIGIAFLAAFMFVVAGVIVSIPYTAGVGDRSGDWIVDVAALIVVGFAMFATFAFVAVVRTQLALDATTIAGTVVANHTWFLLPRFRSFRIPLSNVRSVERRTELFRSLGFTTMREAVSLVTADGERIGLFSDTLGSAETMPIDEVAGALAAAAGIGIKDDGTVRTRGSGLYGAASSSWTEETLDAAGAMKARHSAIFTAQLSSTILLLVFVLRAFL